MAFNVVLSEAAESQLSRYLDYLCYDLESWQAAKSVRADAMATIERLRQIADGLPLCEDPWLRQMGYRIIHFKSHRYLMIYRIVGHDVHIDAVYHSLQNRKNLFRSLAP